MHDYFSQLTDKNYKGLVRRLVANPDCLVFFFFLGGGGGNREYYQRRKFSFLGKPAFFPFFPSESVMSYVMCCVTHEPRGKATQTKNAGIKAHVEHVVENGCSLLTSSPVWFTFAFEFSTLQKVLSFRNRLSCVLTARIFLLFDLSSAVQNICFIYLHSFIHPSRVYYELTT